MAKPSDDLRALLGRVPVLSLAVTDDAGAPQVSLAPYVFAPGPARMHLLVSELAAHTAALRARPRCGWMVHDPPREADPRSNHALERLSGAATARFLTRDEAAAAGVEALWRARFPIAETLLGLRDFHFVELSLADGSVSFVQGFGRAYKVSGADLDEVTHVTGR